MVVDQEPFLKKALSTCKRLRKELHKKQALLNDFEEHDRNAYQQWMNRTQGKKLTQIRELRDESNAWHFILHHLSQCAHFDFEAVPKLFKELLDLKEKGSLYNYVPPKQPDPFGFGGDDDDDDEWDDEDEWDEDDDDDWDDDDDDDDDMRGFFDRMFGGGGSRGQQAGSSRKQKAAEDARLKTCYRNLAKRLHPDHSELEESIREKRWHEIQEAYHNRDLEALVRVEAICDMDDTGLSAELGLARLRDLAAYHQSHLKPIRDALRAAKQDIAFGFAANGPSSEVKRTVNADLKHERVEVQETLAHIKRHATAIRDEVAAQLRANEAAAERALRRAAARKGKKAHDRGAVSPPKPSPETPKPKKHVPKFGEKPPSEPKVPAKPVEENPDQMTFF
jgi:hypothetical protein